MSAATTAEWITHFAIGTGAFIPGALLILSLDHDLWPRMPHLPVEPALHAADRAVQWARLQTAALLLLLACNLQPTEASR